MPMAIEQRENWGLLFQRKKGEQTEELQKVREETAKKAP
jgi:hypothetical protein